MEIHHDLMTKAAVEEALQSKGSLFTTVTFIKKDGSVRTVNGLLKPTSKIVGSERGLAQGAAMKARGQTPIWCVHENSWKCFYNDRVVSVT